MAMAAMWSKSFSAAQSGPLEVAGVQYNGVMPPMHYLSDDDIVNIAAHVVNTFTAGQSTIQAADVQISASNWAWSTRGSRRTGTPEQLRAKWLIGARPRPSRADARSCTPGAPDLSEVEFKPLPADLFRALRRLPWGVAPRAPTGKPLTTDITPGKKAPDYSRH